MYDYKAKDIMNNAKSELSIFEDSKQKESLFVMADFALNRKK